MAVRQWEALSSNVLARIVDTMCFDVLVDVTSVVSRIPWDLEHFIVSVASAVVS